LDGPADSHEDRKGSSSPRKIRKAVDRRVRGPLQAPRQGLPRDLRTDHRGLPGSSDRPPPGHLRPRPAVVRFIASPEKDPKPNKNSAFLLEDDPAPCTLGQDFKCP